MNEKKASILALLNVLREFSDEDHILTQPELLGHLQNAYGLELDRRTLYRNVEMLQDFGYDISTYAENGKGYYLRDREFESSQIFLLCNAIHASHYIPKKLSNELINKLLSTQSRYYKNDFRNTVFVENNLKKDNKEFFLNIEVLSEAIKERKSVSFNYQQYNDKKELVNRKEEPYTLSPYYLVYNLDKTYLIGRNEKYNDFAHYRIDRIKDLKISNDKYIKLNKNEDPYEYAKNKIYMFHGESEPIAIKCDYSILDDVIDTFGKDIRIESHNDYFIAYVKSSKEGMVYLALQYIKYMEILEPQEIRDEIKNTLGSAQKKYK